MYGFEKNLFDQLCRLRDTYDLKGVKAEFEAEGSMFRDLVRLRRITNAAGIALYLKIGGVEAVRDIKDALEIGVDGIIAPMVESPFGLKKFIGAYEKIYGEHRVHLSFNVETRNAVAAIDEILDIAEGRIDNVTIGRSDLSGSYMNPDIFPDCDFILDTIEGVGEKCRARALTMTVGGSISTKTVAAMGSRHRLKSLIHRIETRKIIMSTEIMLSSEAPLKEALHFEELYILSKKEFADRFIKSEVARLTELQWRK